MPGEHMQRAKDGRPMVARVVMAVAAAGLVAAFFLPWASANREFRDAVAAMPGTVLYEPTGMTASDATDLSLFEYARVYASIGEDSGWQIYAAIMYAVLAVSVLAFLLAALGKPVGATVLGLLALAGSRLLVWDFGDRGILPGSTYDWGFAPMIYIVTFVALAGASAWLFLLKRGAKLQGTSKKEVSL